MKRRNQPMIPRFVALWRQFMKVENWKRDRGKKVRVEEERRKSVEESGAGD